MENTDKKPAKKSSKKFILGGVAVVAAIVIVPLVILLGGLGIAFASNTNVPFFSDAVEKIEKTVVSEEKFSEIVQASITDNLFSNIEQVSNIDEDGKLLESDEDLTDLLSNDVEINSYTFDMTMDMDISGSYTYGSTSRDQKMNMDFDISGGIDTTDEENPEMNLVIDGNVDFDGQQGSGNGELRIKDNTMYLNVMDLQTPFPLDQYEDYIGNWINMPLDAEYLDNQNEELSEEDIKKIEELINSEAIADSIKRLPDEVINGVRTYCFEFSLDSESAVEIMNAYSEIYNEELSDDEVEEMRNSFDEIENFAISACVGRRDNLLYKTTVSIEGTQSTEYSSTFVDLELVATFGDYNTDINVEVPENSKSLEEIVMEQQRRAREAQMEAEALQQQYMEEYYQSNGLSY